MGTKTAKQWFELLPDAVRKRATVNTKPYNLNQEYDRLSEAIQSSFVWGKTPEGHEYWDIICRDCKQKYINEIL